MVTWAFPPYDGNLHFAAFLGPDEFRFVQERGWVRVNGQRAVVVNSDDVDLCDPVSGFVRFRFLEPFDDRRLKAVA